MHCFYSLLTAEPVIVQSGHVAYLHLLNTEEMELMRHIKFNVYF